jgi:hypothetical protein
VQRNLAVLCDDDAAGHVNLNLAMGAARVWGCATSLVAECQLSRCPKWLCRYGGQVLEADLFGASEPPSGWWAADSKSVIFAPADTTVRFLETFACIRAVFHPRSLSSAATVRLGQSIPN